ncbi:MAG TPA: hypothetical protein PKJ08_00385 [Candidatus Cloacimonadota bacterium]|nr:hypothetical protein [Candidatus Cloacimonadota bacterium]HOD52958.1 hypothetical protein [Candidatus Cloacimonadota bacterium]
MRRDHNPLEFINRIQKEKYKMLAIPIIVIVINFAVKMFIGVDFVKYISAVAMALYLIILWLYRLSHPNIEINESNLLAPVNGKILEIKKIEDGFQLIILKNWFQSSEIRTMSNLDLINEIEKTDQACFMVKGVWSKIFTEKNPHLQGQLIGVAPGKCMAYINIPDTYEISARLNDQLEAGVSILATSKNASGDSNSGRDDE